MLLKLLPETASQGAQSIPIEMSLPASLYKLRKTSLVDPNSTSSYDCYLKDYYELPDLEVLNDWVVLVESALNGLVTLDGQ